MFEFSDNLAQLRLSNGSEIICEIMEYAEDDRKEMIARNIMSIVLGEYGDGERVYMFKPWIHYLESPLEYSMINSDHVISINRPNYMLISEYYRAVKEMHSMNKEREEFFETEQMAKLSKLIDDLHEVTKKKSDKLELIDKLENKIIKFPTKDDDIVH
jgi:hypothetical protein